MARIDQIIADVASSTRVKPGWRRADIGQLHDAEQIEREFAGVQVGNLVLLIDVVAVVQKQIGEKPTAAKEFRNSSRRKTYQES